VVVVLGEVVHDARQAGVHVAAAELLGGDDLARGRLHERRAAEEDRALLADDDRLVAHRGDVGAARRARPHDARDLRDAELRHRRLVEEDPPEVLAVGEDLVLERQERAARVDEVHARQPVVQRDLLRAQVLLDRHGVVRAALDGRVVGHDDDAPAGDHADPVTIPAPGASPS
jgi:hypothetical protein